jgi:hypothetical protein
MTGVPFACGLVALLEAITAGEVLVVGEEEVVVGFADLDNVLVVGDDAVGITAL